MTRPAWPGVPHAKGHYESFYLRAADPASPRAVWIRHTVHKRPGHPPLGSLWFTLFDQGVHAAKATWPEPRPGEWIEIGPDSSFGPDGARGAIEDVAWDLAITALAAPLRHLPKEWMYGAPLPRTKPESPIPHASFTGTLDVAGRRIDVDGWRGMCGHNWGTEHAETWIWLHGTGFEEDESAWLDLTVARVRVGPVLTPWIANGAFERRGERTRLGGIGRRVKVEASARQARIEIPGQAEIRVRSGDIVVWRYASPDLEERHSAHSSNAELELTAAGESLHTGHMAAYELGARPGAHSGEALQEYPDGT